MHLKQPGFTHSSRGPFTKNKERIEKFMQTRNTDFVYKNNLDKASFHYDMAYGKELTKFCRQEIKTLFKKITLIKLLFNMIWLMVNQNIERSSI